MKNAQTNNNDKINMVMWIEDRDMITLPMQKREKTFNLKWQKIQWILTININKHDNKYSDSLEDTGTRRKCQTLYYDQRNQTNIYEWHELNLWGPSRNTDTRQKEKELCSGNRTCRQCDKCNLDKQVQHISWEKRTVQQWQNSST